MEPHAYVTSCRIELLGGLKIKYGTSVITQFRSRKTAALLAYLALYPGEHSRESLIDLLWPECSLDAGRNSLRVSLTSLRSLFNTLQPSGSHLSKEVGIPAHQSFLHTDRSVIGLNRDMTIVDCHQFERRLQKAALNEDSAGSLKLLRHALDSYDRLLPEFYEDWTLSESQRLDTLFFASLRKLLAQLNNQGDAETAIAYARRGLALDETREDIHRDLMCLLLDTGQSSAAYQHFKALEELLQRKYEVAPDLATRQLGQHIQQVLRSSETSPQKGTSRAKDFSLWSENPLSSKASDQPGASDTQLDSSSDNVESASSTKAAAELTEAQVREVVMDFFDHLSHRRAFATLPLFMRPDATVTGVSEGGGAEIVWHRSAEEYTDVLQRELVNLAVDTPFLVEGLHVKSIGALTVARAFVVNPWVYSQYIMVFTTEGGTPKITSITLASCLPIRLEETGLFDSE